MSFKKNAFSYFIWIIFIMCNLVVFSFLSLMCAKVLGGPLPVVAFGLAAAFFGLLFFIYFLTGYLSKKLYSAGKVSKKEKSIRNRLIAEAVIAVCFLAAGVGLRIYLLPTAGEAAAYFDVAKVSQDSSALLVPVQNSVYYYLCLLHGMFLIFGNQWIAGIWLQIGLQLLAGIVLYFLVRKMAGATVPIITLGYLMFAPSAVRISLLYAPDMLYFLVWTLGLLFAVLYLNAGVKGTKRHLIRFEIWMWIAAVLVGVMIGFLTYVDVSGIVLLIPVLMLPMVLREVKKKGIWIGRMLLAVAAVAGGFAGFIFLDGLLSGTGFLRVLYAWGSTFQPEAPDLVLLMQNSSLEVMILLVLMSVNVFSFYRRRDRDVTTVWILMTFVMAVLYVMGITTESMNGRPLLLILMCISAAVSFKELFWVKIDAVTQKASKEVVKEDIIIPAEEATIQFIENPLPLPKKHVKRTMDYAFVPEAAKMNYDIEISENDDFDV